MVTMNDLIVEGIKVIHGNLRLLELVIGYGGSNQSYSQHDYTYFSLTFSPCLDFLYA